MGKVRSLETRPVIFVRQRTQAAGEPFEIQTFQHPFLEPLFFLEPVDFKRMDEREVADALRYAQYLKSRGQGFLFVSYFEKLSVPSFDGVVFDLKSGSPLFNVQMKHSNPLFRPLTVAELNTGVSSWARESSDLQTKNQERWFSAVNHFNRTQQVARLGNGAEVGIENFVRFEMLAYVFGLFPGGGSPPRPLWLVRDLSDFGMSYETITSPQYKSFLEKALSDVHHDGLTMFWNKNQVLEYPPNR